MSRVLNNATTWVLSIWEADLPPSSKLVAAYLRSYMNDYTEVAWPSVGTISQKTGLSVRSVQGHLKKLTGEGWLTDIGESELRTRTYRIAFPEHALRAQPLQGANTAGVQITTPEGATIAPELNKELNNTREKGRMARPTVQEVADYCVEKGYTFSPEGFHAFYESKGWKVGNQPMKKWQSACVTWQRREDERNGKRAADGRGADESGRKLQGAERTRRARENARRSEQGLPPL